MGRFGRLLRKKPVEMILAEASGGGHEEKEGGLRKELGVFDLTSFGIAAIIGAGIFSTIGNVAFNGGPACIFLFLFTAIACGFAALCYAEFSSRIPISGSAYTYAYASFGEIVAWIIGWDLLMEYAISNIVVAVSWSDYLTSFLDANGLGIPKYLTMDFMTASRGAAEVQGLLSSGKTMDTLQAAPELRNVLDAWSAWMNAPLVSGIHIVADIPALVIISIVTAITYVGIRESKLTSNVMVLLKVAVILLVIAVGAMYVQPRNWVPFAPNGFKGVLNGVAGVFFAYIGFDAISTTAEECRNPQRDLPRAMIYSLVICTILYIVVALVLTGMVSYRQLAVGDPLAYVFGAAGANVPWMSALISITSIVCMTTVLLVYQIGQPRIWMAMSRDGLLPPIFSSIHSKFRTPWFSTLVTGVFVAVPALFLNLTEVTDLTSIGTLFAFLLVCGGVLVLQQKEKGGDFLPQPGFRIPYYNSRYIIPVLVIAGLASLFVFESTAARDMLGTGVPLGARVPMAVFIVFSLFIATMSYAKSLSLIPVLGLLSCGYLITELGLTNWLRFAIWLLFGLTLYFAYGSRHSRLG